MTNERYDKTMKIDRSNIKLIFEFSPIEYFLVYEPGRDYEYSLNPRIDRSKKGKDDDCGMPVIFLSDEEAKQAKEAGFSCINYSPNKNNHG